jgi:hypothetical protein
MAGAPIKKSVETHFARVQQRTQQVQAEVKTEIETRLAATGIDVTQLLITVMHNVNMRWIDVCVTQDHESIRRMGSIAFRAQLERTMELVPLGLPGWIKETYGLIERKPSEPVQNAAEPGALFGRWWYFGAPPKDAATKAVPPPTQGV